MSQDWGLLGPQEAVSGALAFGSLRVSVFVQWVGTYLTGQRGSRLIVKHHGSASCARPASSSAEARLLTTRSSSRPRHVVFRDPS